MLKIARALAMMLLIFVLIDALVLVEVNFASDQQLMLAVISVSPEESVYDIDQYFTINISIANVWNLSIWKFDLSYDDRILYTNQTMIVVDPDKWFSQNGSICDFPRVKVTHGNITLSDLLLDEEAGTTGNGTLAKVTFLVQATGNSTLHLLDTIIYDPYWALINHTLKDGSFHTPPAIMYVDPETNFHDPNAHFTINISIANVTCLNLWEATLTFDSEILKCIFVKEGPFLSDVGSTVFEVKITPGEIIMGCSLTGPVCANGSGTLTIIEFEVLRSGKCDLDLKNTKPYDTDLKPILHIAEDGSFYTSIPVASFDYDPKEIDIYKTLVNFTGSTSYDPNGIITTYSWDFGDGSPNETGPPPKYVNVTHRYMEYGTYMVKLTVTDNETKSDFKEQRIKIEKNVAIDSVELPYPHFKEVPSGSVVNITVTVVNLGTMTVNFSVILDYNGTSLPDNPKKDDFVNPIQLGEQEVYDLWGSERAGANTTRELTFMWDTTGVSDGNYTFMAIIPPLAGESDLDDNWYIAYTNATVWDALVIISGLEGDINEDGKVDWKDLLIFAMAYGCHEGEPCYVAEADFNSDEKIDWKDLLVLARNYGKQWEQP